MSGNNEENSGNVFPEMPEPPHLHGMDEPRPNLIDPFARWLKNLKLAAVPVCIVILVIVLAVASHYLLAQNDGKTNWPWQKNGGGFKWPRL